MVRRFIATAFDSVYSMTLRRAAVAVLALVPVAVIACGGGSGASSKTSAPSPRPSTNKTATATGRGYEADMPAGWSVQTIQSQVESPTRYPPDVFIAPSLSGLADRTTTLQRSITVACLSPSPGITDVASAQSQWATVIAEAANSLSTAAGAFRSELNVAGQPAVRFDYSVSLAGDHKSDRADVVFVADGCRWLIRLTTVLGTGKADMDFATFLQSFRLVS